VQADGSSTGQTCSSCPAGTYSPVASSSDCIPCDPGTYQDQAASSSCNSCATDTYAYLPGATACLKCIGGRPVSCTSSCSDTSTPSDGYATAVVTTLNTLNTTLCDLGGWPSNTLYPYPLLMSTCTMDTTTKLSLYVSATCEVTIRPMGDPTLANSVACSDPNNLDVPLTAYYTKTNFITTALDTTDGTLLTIEVFNQTSGRLFALS